MWTRCQAFFFAPMLLAVTMGSTDCESYSTVTVPASDSTAPVAYDGVWRDGEYVELRGSGGSGILYHLRPGESVVAVSSGLDGQGLRKVTMSIERSWLCCSGDICSSSSTLSAPIVSSQAGGVGSKVSNGIWVGDIVGSLPSCNPGYTLESYRFAWRTEAENFHGGKVTSARHQIVYP